MTKISLSFFVTIALAVLVDASKLEVTANSLYTTQDTVHADEGVVVYYNDAVIKAQRASYNKKTKLLVLDERVEVIGYNGTKEFTNHMEIQTDTNEASFKELFLSAENDIWLYASKAHQENNMYHLGKSMLSSCDVNNPLWKMLFEDAVYDKENEYMKVYHARIHLWDIPIFYTPYLGFSTNKQRSSGLLFPKIGYRENEGILYEQPIFWNIAENMDLELNPQIRSERSLGIYSTFRFVDSNHSKGVVRTGYFKDKQSYIDTYSPQNDNHYGLEFNYESTNVLQSYLPTDMKDGLYINSTYLNDIDYLNLQKSKLGHFGIRPRQESRVNYFIHNASYYAGLNAKYFIDTRAKDNDKTLQQLPSLHWHKYLDTLVWNNLTYSLDAHVSNITRKTGATMKQAEFKLPLEYSTSFWNNYLNFSASNAFYYSKYLFANETLTHDTYQYYSNVQKVEIATDLTKQYANTVHVVQPSIEYVNNGTDKQSPTAYSDLSETQKELFAVGLAEESIHLGLKNYFYDENMRLYFFQRLSQKYYPSRTYKFSEVENEMQYIIDDWNFYNYTLYSPKYSKVDSMINMVQVSNKIYNFSLSHSYKEYLNPEIKHTRRSDLNFNFNYNINQRVRLNGGLAYDLEKEESKQWRLGVGYFRDCWSIDASVSDTIRATSNGPEDIRSFYVQLNFVPFGSVGTGNYRTGNQAY